MAQPLRGALIIFALAQPNESEASPPVWLRWTLAILCIKKLFSEPLNFLTV
jgi:hypothetical protein